MYKPDLEGMVAQTELTTGENDLESDTDGNQPEYSGCEVGKPNMTADTDQFGPCLNSYNMPCYGLCEAEEANFDSEVHHSKFPSSANCWYILNGYAPPFFTQQERNR